MFSPAEMRVVELLEQILSIREIAEKLHIAETTVKFHITQIYRKSGVKNYKEFLRARLKEKGFIGKVELVERKVTTNEPEQKKNHDGLRDSLPVGPQKGRGL